MSELNLAELPHDELTRLYDSAIMGAVDNILKLNTKNDFMDFVAVSTYLDAAERASKLFAEKIDPFRAFRGYELVIAAAYHAEGLPFLDHGIMESQFKAARALH